jgi:hypothetical protein
MSVGVSVHGAVPVQKAARPCGSRSRNMRMRRRQPMRCRRNHHVEVSKKG